MASHRVLISETAQTNIENIYLFLIENGTSGETALDDVLDLDERCQKLGTMPMAGREMMFDRACGFLHMAVAIRSLTSCATTHFI